MIRAANKQRTNHDGGRGAVRDVGRTFHSLQGARKKNGAFFFPSTKHDKGEKKLKKTKTRDAWNVHVSSHPILPGPSHSHAHRVISLFPPYPSLK